MIDDASIDFVFSFDSLVHVEPDVIESYLRQLAVKLKPDGVGFFHHSNLGQYEKRMRRAKQIRTLLLKRRFIWRMERFFNEAENLNVGYWRSLNVTAELFRKYCARSGLACISQELINWHETDVLIDCLSLFTKAASMYARDCVIAENNEFMREAEGALKLALLYPRKPNMSLAGNERTPGCQRLRRL